MTPVDQRINHHDLETPDSIQVRFGIEYVESRPPEATAVVICAAVAVAVATKCGFWPNG